MIRILSLATLSALLVACGTSSDEPYGGEIAKSDKQRVTSPQVDGADFTKQVEGNSAFAFDLYKQISAEDGNLFFSPHSISVALAMLHAGARGDTEQQMSQALHFDLAQDKLHPAFNKLDLELNSRGKGAKAADGKAFRLSVVNAIWGELSFDFLADYLDTIALNYGAGLRLLDFKGAPDPSRIVINDWVEDETEGRIKDLLPKGVIDSMTRLVLTNAIYFNAAWAEPFEEQATADGDFELLDGSKVTVPLMHGMMGGRHHKGADFTAAELPYDGHELSMLVIVPEAGKFDSVEKSLDAALVADIVKQAKHCNVQLTLPKFEFDASLDLVEKLKALGVQDAFDGAKADLSGIDGRRDLYVTAVLHKAFVKVNEAGTEAAAATAVVVGETSAPEVETLSADRPFFFLIRDNATGAIIFLGRVVNPK